MKKSPVAAFAYWARNVRSAKLFKAIREFCRGDVLDVGGRDFYRTVKESHLDFRSWTALETNKEHLLELDDAKYKSVHGDGCAMTFPTNTFDTVLNVQVLEHVMEPDSMVSEISRVLRPGGRAIFLIPQTAVLHELPGHYYNFTPFWIKETFAKHNLQILKLEPLGGMWSSMASHLVYFFFHAFRFKGYSTPDFKRNVLFYLFFPLMVVYALLNIPICLFLSLGDLTEEPNNNLVIAEKI